MKDEFERNLEDLLNTINIGKEVVILECLNARIYQKN